MLLVTAIDGRSEPIVTARDFKRNRRVNAEKEISFSLLSDETDSLGFELVQSLSTIRFQNDTYVIDEFEEYGEGDRTIKNIGAVHEFFPKMIDIYEYDTTSGTKTFGQILGFIFNDTPYVYSIVDSFDSQTFENFGDDNKLALFQKALDEFGAEFELIGNTVRLKKQIGTHTDFQFRYNFNIKTFSREEDVKGLTTYVKGFGQPMVDGSGNPSGSYVVQGEYSSPNIAIFGKREAKPVRDDRITNLTTLTKAMQAAIQDTPLISLKLDFIDLRAAGYPYIVPNEGDYVWCIYEPMNGLTLEVRITELEESFDFYLNPIDTAVTLANMRKDVTDTLAGFNSTSKTVDKVFTSTGTVKTDILSEDVKNATRAVNSALTEIVFQNGIRAIDPSNPNQIVVFTSAGIGISDDGGTTYRAAITGDGAVADILTSGILNTKNVRIQGDTDFYWDGEAIIAQDSANVNKFVKISKEGIQITTDGGVTFQTAVNANGVIADSIKSNGSIDVATDIRVGKKIQLGQDFQDNDLKEIEFNGPLGGARILFVPDYDQIALQAINSVKVDSTYFYVNAETIRIGVETGHCGVGGYDGVGTLNAVAGVYVQFKQKRETPPTSITLTTSSTNVGTNDVHAIDITEDGFWLYLNGNGNDGNYRYWRGTYATVD